MNVQNTRYSPPLNSISFLSYLPQPHFPLPLKEDVICVSPLIQVCWIRWSRVRLAINKKQKYFSLKEHQLHRYMILAFGSNSVFLSFLMREAVAWRCSVKNAFLEISQNSQKNTCARVSFLLKKRLAQVLSCEFS